MKKRSTLLILGATLLGVPTAHAYPIDPAATFQFKSLESVNLGSTELSAAVA